MGIRERLSGNEAVAFAMKQINPDVMGAFPITPSTEIPQYFSTYVDNGQVDTEFIPVESEHSAMSTCIGAEAAGCRAVSATSSCGLCYMTEMLYVAASDRLPITLAVSTRALSGPININNDHSDAMGVRDTGWLMLFAETNQEAYDNYLQAMRIGEAVSLPIMVCQDGFITSHAIENIELVEDEKVKAFVGEYKPKHFLLNKDEPMAVGAYATPVYYMECKRAQAQAMMDAKEVIKKVGAEFGQMTGRTYGLIEKYRMDDAEEAIVIIGSSAGTAKEAVNELREQGKKVGLIKVRAFRPFPSEEIVDALKNVKAFAVMDKDDSFNGHCGPMFAEVAASMYAAGVSAPKGISYIYGLGGRDVRVESIQHVFAELAEIAATGVTGETYRYLDVRE
ncbi:pyruvate ferredoxin oxidoreductase [uncultured Oscillibacter sp.]|uniref:pyruvate ferredoxin oxidoreductase n=1 Tax=uncultured Oscillibacter sp. TaxID=876091 RepID=UPI0025DE0264|nr:pyruvate ferredoxin oxidoreductase [uncultured Oscillibacter sp.]